MLDALVALALVAALAVAASSMIAPTERSVGAVRVIDGDTLAQGGSRIRLRDMDAPELDQICRSADGLPYRCGEVARRALEAGIGTQAVTCAISGHDRYGRKLGRCEAGGVDLGGDLVRRGLAVSYGGYRAEERAARSAGSGLWSGSFEPPSAWRQAHPRPGLAVAAGP